MYYIFKNYYVNLISNVAITFNEWVHIKINHKIKFSMCCLKCNIPLVIYKIAFPINKNA